MRATTQNGDYPRPMMCRGDWISLDGTWDFAHDDADAGVAARWFDQPAADPFHRSIEVPYPPESPASGIAERGFHPVVWYRRRIAHDALARSGAAERDRLRTLVHFGAVDYRARVWLDGQLVASHVGGQTPFTADVTEAMAPDLSEHVLVVRAEDDPGDLDQPRGKQDWRDQPHGIWYERTTGIWQPVWAEVVQRDHLVDLSWTPDIAGGVVHGEFSLARTPREPLVLELTLSLDDEIMAEQSVVVRTGTAAVDLAVVALRNGQDRARLTWTPEHPVLLDVEVVLRERGSGREIDRIASYVGLRSASVGGGAFELNATPYYVRSVLNQGYRPDTHLAALNTNVLRTEVETIKSIGFNAVRIHQKAEDPRFLYWADRLGLLVWGETATAYAFSTTAVELLTAEWVELVRRDRSHPCIVTWVPVNESWGVQDIATSAAQQHYAAGLASLTRALDPSRPVVSNEGWEHVDSDILGLHDYATDPERLRTRYRDQAAVDTALSAHGPHGRRPILSPLQREKFLAGNAPLMITEFGGVSLSDDGDAWGYTHAGSDSEYASLLLALFDALRASTTVAGFCYTQYIDTAQETNGLLYSDGTPKLPIDTLRHIVTGTKDGAGLAPPSTTGWTA